METKENTAVNNHSKLWEFVRENRERLVSLEGKTSIIVALDIATFAAVLGLIIARTL